MIVDFADGGSERLFVQTLSDGTVLIEHDIATADAGIPVRRGSSTAECSDDYDGHSLNLPWLFTMDWYIKTSSVPAYLTTSAVVDDSRAAVTNITHQNNNCGMSDTIEPAWV